MTTTLVLCAALSAGAPPPPPPPTTKAPPDLTLFLDWLRARGEQPDKEVDEAEQLRLGAWRFFSHGSAPGYITGRVGLDGRGHHVIVRDRSSGKTDWHLFLSEAKGDAEAALKRWLFLSFPAGDARGAVDKRLPAPTLTQRADGAWVLKGWVWYPPESVAQELTLTAPVAGETTMELGKRR